MSHGHLRQDSEDFLGSDYGKRYELDKLCRGKRLWALIQEIGNGGWETGVQAVGGFSEDPSVCKQFGARGREQKDGPPAVYYARVENLKEQHPSLQPIQYTEEWLTTHPDVIRICQTIPECKRPLCEEIGSAICYKGEKEWVALEEKVRPLDLVHKSEYDGKEYEHHSRGKINIYLSDREIARLGVNLRTGYGTGNLPDVCKAMAEAKEKLESVIPSDLPIEYFQLYYCDSDSDLVNAHSSGTKDSNCELHSYLEPKGKPFKDGFEPPPSTPVW